VAESLGRARDQLVKLSEDVHTLSRQLHPSILDDLGLVDALRSECAGFQQREGLVVAYHAENAPAGLPRDTALCLYRIAQEALRNVARHAEARRAEVSLIGNNGDVLLTVCDEGKGFDLSALRARPGLGLASMEERARLIGAELSIQSHPGKGTTVGVLVPLRGREP
jgi:two-component system, NarL family, sensor kinase